MGAILFIALVTVPIIEIAIFLEVGDFIGFWPTMGVIVLTAFIGATLLRWQGLATLRKAQASLEQNRFPMEEVFDGLCLLVAGVLLLTPGFFTDAVGFFLFVPVFRRFLARHVARLGKGITRSVAREIAQVKRGAILKGEAGIGRKNKDLPFEQSRQHFEKWAEANKKPRTVKSYKECLRRLAESFSGKRLSEIVPFAIERHKQARIQADARVRANRELV